MDRNDCLVAGCDGLCDHYLPAPLIRFLEERPRSDPHAIHVTDLVYCPRKAYFRLVLNCPELTPSRSLFARNLGHLFHDRMAELADNVFEIAEAQLKRDIKVFRNTYTVVGTPDLLRYYSDDESYDIIDYKVVSSLPKNPKPAHCLQLSLYAWLLNKPINSLQVIYINTRGVMPYEIPVPNLQDIDDYVWHAVKTIFHEEPKPLEKGKDSECYTCPYLYVCGKQLPTRRAKE